jgi:hypothetical protein
MGVESEPSLQGRNTRLRVVDNGVNNIEIQEREVTGSWRKSRNEELLSLYHSPDVN